MSSSLATTFGTIGTDILGIGGGIVTLIKDLITAGTGGTTTNNAGQYPWST